MSVLSCPNCGTPHEPANPGIALIACDSCGSTLYREGDLLRQGVEARLAEPRSSLAVGKEGSVQGRAMTVVGRAGFSWGGGRWDEWYVVDRTGREAWLVEDGRRYTLETPIDPPAGLAGVRNVGDQVLVDGVPFEVREIGHATCEGAQGQLPRPVQPESVYAFLDLDELQGGRRLLVERDPDGEIEAFLGTVLDPTAVDFGVADTPSGPATQAHAVRCPQCGAPTEVPTQRDPVVTLACGYCDAVFEPDGEVGTLLGRRGETPPYLLEIGDTGSLQGVDWEVVGRMLHVEPDGWRTAEFLLHNPTAGYAWLEESNGHCVLLERATRTPSLRQIQALTPGGRARIDGVSYRMVEVGTSELQHVDGALPWRARFGDESMYVDLIHPPLVASVSVGEGEAEFFTGVWLPGHDVAAAFDRSDRYHGARGIHPAQPNPVSGWLGVAGVAVVAAVINCGLGGMTTDGALVHQGTFSVSEAAALGGDARHQAEDVLSDPFPLGVGPGSRIELRTNVDNSWVWTAVELIDGDGDGLDAEPQGLFSEEVGYYHGVEDGESWSEGSTRKDLWFRTPEPGTYRLRLAAESDRPTQVGYRVYDGAKPTTGFWLVAALGALVAGILGAWFVSIEGSRISDDEDD